MHRAIYSRVSDLLLHSTEHRERSIPSKLPCSQSTNTQSTPDLASSRDTFAPGIICHAPNEVRPWFSAVLNRLEACIADIDLTAPRMHSWFLNAREGLKRSDVDVQAFMVLFSRLCIVGGEGASDASGNELMG